MKKKKVYISAVGLIEGNNRDDINNCMRIKADQYKDLISKFQLRNVDRVSQLALAAACLALKNREIMIGENISNDVGLFLGTEYGALDSIHSFDMVSVENGALRVNPGLFPNTVLNSPTCQASIKLSIAGPAYTINNGMTSALDAVGMGYQNIKAGLLSMALAGGTDEATELQTIMHRDVLDAGEASGFVVLESDDFSLDKKEAFEIIEYNSINFNNCDAMDVCKHTTNMILATMDSLEISIDMIDGINFNTSLALNSGKKLAEDICRELDFEKKYEYMSVDWMGASGIVQIASAIEGLKKSGQDKGIWIITAIDQGKITVIFLMK